MKYQKVKIALIALCVLAAGICYSAGRYREARAERWTEELALTETSIIDSGETIPESRKESDGKLKGLGPSETEVRKREDIPSVSGKAGEPDSLGSAGGKTALPFYIHICGEVISPGVYELEDGSRVFQAVEKAGGFTDQAASEYLNMAERITDGMKIVVLSREEAKAARARGEISLSQAASPGTQKIKVNLNTATKEELMTLRGVGEAKANDILQYRESHGGFQKIEDIMKISGIKDAAFQKIKDDITV